MIGNSIDYSTQNALSLSPVENFRDINNRNERDKAFKGSFFLSLCVSLCLSDEASIYEAQQADDF